MDITWAELQINDIEVEETELPQEEFEHLFGELAAAGPVSN
jgi:hypothetical protein